MSLQARLIKAVTRRTIKRSGLNQQQLVRHLRKVFNDTPVLTLLPRGVTLSRVEQDAFTGDRISVKQPKMTVPTSAASPRPTTTWPGDWPKNCKRMSTCRCIPSHRNILTRPQ